MPLKSLISAVLAVLICRSASAVPDYNGEIRPILSGRCYKCHGPDDGSREANFRLDERSAAIAKLESGETGIVPGHPEQSAIVSRITTTDPDLRMPPPSEGAPLSAHEIELLQSWVKAGAPYAKHWAYVPPQRPKVPMVAGDAWSRTAIDRFVLAKLQAEQLAPSPQADRAALLRRVTLDLTGLPPSIEDLDAFSTDARPDAYERVVDRLLSSPAFGERWGRVWLDLARYADSAGYADDPPRTIWLYRDWVIDALNSNMPFDQFTVEQIAGDLLPNATTSQRIATGFHRNTMTNSEGGTDDEEFRNVAIVDRVNTTLQVWMATTIMCAQCHNHKYDPISQQDYYKVFAVLNQTEDADRRDETPLVSMFTPDQEAQRAALQKQIADADAELKSRAGASDAPKLVDGPVSARYVRIELPGKEKILSLAEVQVFAGDSNVAQGKAATQSSVAYEGPPNLAVDGNTDGDFTSARSTTHTKTEDSPWWEVDLGSTTTISNVAVWNRTDGGIGNRLDGFQVILLDDNRQPRWVHAVPQAAAKDGQYTVPATSGELSEADRTATVAWLEDHSPAMQAARAKLKSLRDQLAAVMPLTTPVMQELGPAARRKTRIQIRGNFLDLGEEVSAGMPGVFEIPVPPSPDRMALARWLVDPANPLTSRVLVNRMWEQLFGMGLVETSEEFGLQGELPSHPELLDWMAVELQQRQWNFKDMLRLMVTSATYQQSSNGTPALVQRDPNNRLLARGPRFRLEAEMVRDQALFIAGLLSDKEHGPSVKPPRPRLGLTAAFGGSTDWDASGGEDRYRRGLYTFWQRSIPYPSMDTFDAPSREVCVVRRTRTNTPLQALVTMNDPVYVEASQAFARELLTAPGIVGVDENAESQRLELGFRMCLSRVSTSDERNVLLSTLQAALKGFEGHADEAGKIATEPLGPLPAGIEPIRAAAWTVVCGVLLNLDETLTRR
jgi:hypothetical protein